VGTSGSKTRSIKDSDRVLHANSVKLSLSDKTCNTK